MEIFSVRKICDLISHDVVYEWEDYIDQHSDCRLLFCGRVERKLGWILRPFFRKKIKWSGAHPKLFFCMNIDELEVCTFFRKDVLPIMLDLGYEDISKFIYVCQELPLFWVTSYKTYKVIMDEYHNLQVRYLPLFVSDDAIKADNENKQRTIDIIQIGRKNQVLHDYAMKYSYEHKGCNYVYREWKGDEYHYISTVEGDIGPIKERQKYIDLLRSATISLVSTPKMDDSRDFGGDIDFFTPRFYESSAAGCGLIARYSDIEEAQIIGIDEICKSVDSYEAFETEVQNILSMSYQDRIQMYGKLAKNNSAQKRTDEIISTLTVNGII